MPIVWSAAILAGANMIHTAERQTVLYAWVHLDEER